MSITEGIKKERKRPAHSPPWMSLLYAELLDTFFFTRDFWLGGVHVSAGDERLCTVWEKQQQQQPLERVFFSLSIETEYGMCSMHMDYLNDKR